jgi:hypothetical protein
MTALAVAQRRTIAPNYDPVKEITIQGTVEEVLTAQRGTMTGVHLKVRFVDKTFDVRLGSARFLKQKQFTFAAGDRIDVTGATISTKTGDALIAREVKKSDSVLVLHDAKSFPVWSGRRVRPTSSSDVILYSERERQPEADMERL